MTKNTCTQLIINNDVMIYRRNVVHYYTPLFIYGYNNFIRDLMRSTNKGEDLIYFQRLRGNRNTANKNPSVSVKKTKN